MGDVLGDGPGTGPPVVPLALCRPGDVLHGALRRYKDAPVAEARRHHAELLAQLLDRSLRAPTAAAGAAPLASVARRCDALAVVPSSARSAIDGRGASPLLAVVGHSDVLASMPRAELRRGSAPCGHLHPAADAFVADAALAGGRVLLLEDAWVTGARARSAAGALAAAGAVVEGIVVLGRVVDPEAAPWVARWWAMMQAMADRHAAAS